MNTSPSLSPPGSDLDGLVERRLERFIEGETARTIYKLPKSGRLDPQRADVKAVLSTLLSERALRERVPDLWTVGDFRRAAEVYASLNLSETVDEQ